MIINSVKITKFRGFQNTEFKLGSHLTVIAGQNGTQKTTLLGILSQPFTITDQNNPMIVEKPLCGGNFKSSFSDKFKLSPIFDVAKNHEWTIFLNKEEDNEFTVESIIREKSKIRFWRKGTKTKGSGYIQTPVIYLSLSRLFPIGEDNMLNLNTTVTLTPQEFTFYQTWHNKILIIPDVLMSSINYLTSNQKFTLGVNTDFYDWYMNSAGQDNIGKILLAILSFKRLKEKYPEKYSGGLLVIDELDATLYPASQIKLLEALSKFASEYKIQIIFTTHSLNILEKACELQNNLLRENQVRVIYLKKHDSQINIIQGPSFENIKHSLNVTLSQQNQRIKKISVYSEDEETDIFFKALIKRKFTYFKMMGIPLGCGNLIELAGKKISEFSFPQSLIILDGDVRMEANKVKKIKKLKNILILPGNQSPERLIAEFLHDLSDGSPIWGSIHDNYNKQVVFRDITLYEIQQNREKAKEWFRSQKQYWGRNCTKIITPWIKEHQEVVDDFLKEFQKILDEFQKM